MNPVTSGSHLESPLPVCNLEPKLKDWSAILACTLHVQFQPTLRTYYILSACLLASRSTSQAKALTKDSLHFVFSPSNWRAYIRTHTHLDICPRNVWMLSSKPKEQVYRLAVVYIHSHHCYSCSTMSSMHLSLIWTLNF